METQVMCDRLTQRWFVLLTFSLDSSNAERSPPSTRMVVSNTLTMPALSNVI